MLVVLTYLGRATPMTHTLNDARMRPTYLPSYLPARSMTDVSRRLEVQEKLASAAFDRSNRVGRAAPRAGIRDEALTR